MTDLFDEFVQFRLKMNQRIHDAGNVRVRQFFALDGRVYEEGALDVKTKEMIGFTASLMLRCDDCINYHIVKMIQEGVTVEQFFEVLAIGLIVGGSIEIPHIRRAVVFFDECLERKEKGLSLDMNVE